MPTTYNASKGCHFQGRKILFDTNVWIAIYGFDPTQNRPQAYSDFYAAVGKTDNVVVVNDYVLGEFFNRTCKLEFELRNRLHFEEHGIKLPHFKKYRRSLEFRDFAEGVRDTCLNMVEDGVFEPVNGVFDISALLAEAATGAMDFNDLVLREHCKSHSYVVVSHDGDFADCGLDFVTANKRLLGGG